MAAFNTVQTNVVRTAGYEPALIIVSGTYASSAGATGGVIAPGYDNANGTFTASADTAGLGARTIAFGPFYTSTSASPSSLQTVISYDTTKGRDIATVTSAANQTGTYTVYCFDNGQ